MFLLEAPRAPLDTPGEAALERKDKGLHVSPYGNGKWQWGGGGCTDPAGWPGPEPGWLAWEMANILVTHTCLFKDNQLSLGICYGERRLDWYKTSVVFEKKIFFTCIF